MKLPKAYKAARFEDVLYKKWEKSGAFKPIIKKGKKPFSIMMPPPNATGTLHLGHAVMLALEDIMVRYHRMKGDSTLWIPGTDHASIATQNKVEKLIALEGLSRHSMGRKAFLKRVDQFVKGSQNTIRRQVRKMGSSCDWSREHYTLEPQLSRAVQEIFVRMFHDGLIYRGHRIVNWCTRCASTLADDEVNYKEERTRFYYLKYGPFVIGTVRPETKFLDKIIVVHPDDPRYRRFIGTSITVPWIEGDVEASVIADIATDMNFGSGAMTITPAHDFTDFEIAKCHNLEIIQIIDEKGNLNAHAGSFQGMNARDAREKIIEKLQQRGLVEKIEENYVHNVALCYRCDTPIEPLVSEQWFIDVDKKFITAGEKKLEQKNVQRVKSKKNLGKSLKERAIEVVKKNLITIIPDRFEKTYFHWMENLHDWCISRQIWFGHRIPVWYCSCGEQIVTTKSPKKCPRCGSKKLQQDADTLDTWFSSGLWTFSTLGWPQNALTVKGALVTKGELGLFHPTSVLETGYDILFFWVARMILMSSYALNEVPFKHVYLHGLVRTREGKKMSKSNPETCIDPLDMITKYGADALRLSMVIGATPGNDIRLYEEKIAGFRNFVNKMWNAARFALMQIEQEKKLQSRQGKKKNTLSLADKWILTRTQQIIKHVTHDLDTFNFSDAGNTIYDFTWNEYCAWYLEISKGEHKNIPVLTYVLETILALAHPYIPYVTEAIWGHLGSKKLLITHNWPIVDKKKIFKKEADEMSIIIEIISAVRALRQENGIDVGAKIPLYIISRKYKKILEEKREPIMRLARLNELILTGVTNKKIEELKSTLRSFIKGVEIIMPVGSVIDVAGRKQKIAEEIENIERYIHSLQNKLANKQFIARAPMNIITADKERLLEAQEKLKKHREQANYL